MYLVAATAALALGPVCYHFLRRYSRLNRALEIGVTAVAAIMALFFLPHAIEGGGWSALVFTAAGVLGPSLAEIGLRRGVREVHVLTLALTILGLGAHTMVDGAAIAAVGADTAENALGIGIVLHRFPIGLAVWWLVRANLGDAPAIGAILLMAVGTIAGFMIGGEMLEFATSQQLAWLTAFVAGSILHLTFHRLPFFGGHSH